MNGMICIAVLACVASCAFALIDFPDNTIAVGAPAAVAQPMSGAGFVGSPAMGAPMLVPAGMQMGYPTRYAAGSSSGSGSLSPLLLLVLLSQGTLSGSSSSSSSSSSDLIQTLILLSVLGGNTSGGLLG